MEVMEVPQSSLRVYPQDLKTSCRLKVPLKVLPLSNNGLLWDSHPTYRRRWRDLVSKAPHLFHFKVPTVPWGCTLEGAIFRTLSLVIQSFVLPTLCGQLEIRGRNTEMTYSRPFHQSLGMVKSGQRALKRAGLLTAGGMAKLRSQPLMGQWHSLDRISYLRDFGDLGNPSSFRDSEP